MQDEDIIARKIIQSNHERISLGRSPNQSKHQSNHEEPYTNSLRSALPAPTCDSIEMLVEENVDKGTWGVVI